MPQSDTSVFGKMRRPAAGTDRSAVSAARAERSLARGRMRCRNPHQQPGVTGEIAVHCRSRVAETPRMLSLPTGAWTVKGRAGQHSIQNKPARRNVARARRRTAGEGRFERAIIYRFGAKPRTVNLISWDLLVRDSGIALARNYRETSAMMIDVHTHALPRRVINLVERIGVLESMFRTDAGARSTSRHSRLPNPGTAQTPS